MTGGTTITTDKALFDLEDYDGQITTDLFGEHGVFADADQFWKAQSKAIAAQVEAYLADGWRDVSCLERGQFFHKWDHAQRSKEEGGKVYIELRHDGTVTCYEGYVTQAEARRLDRAASGETNTEPAQIKPEMSGPMADYIGLHRHGAARASLLKQPAIALRLMVAHAMTGSVLWDVKRHEARSRKEDTLASLEGSKAAQEMKAAQEKVSDLFAALNVNGSARRNGDAYRLCEVFVALLAMSDEEVMQVLAFTMADTLEAGGAIVEAVANVCETDMASYWKPEPIEVTALAAALNAVPLDIIKMATISPDAGPAICARDMNFDDDAAHADL